MAKQTKRFKRASNGVFDTFKHSLDLFGQTVAFEINGAGTLTSCSGACISLMILIVVSSFAVNRFQTMYDFEDTTHQQTVVQGSVTDTIYQN